MTNRERYDELVIQHDGDEWRVIGVGAEDEGRIMCHLASTTRGSHRRNGWCPAQIGDWIDKDVLEAARDPISQYYEDRNASGQSPLNAHR